MIEEVRIPEISENVKSGNIVRVLVKVGDMIEVDDVLVEFETEKALVDIPSTVKGKITELLAKEGDEMQVGDVLARVDTEAGESAEGDQDVKPAADDEKEAAEETPPETPADESPAEEKAQVRTQEKTAVKEEEKPRTEPEPSETEKQTGDRVAARGPVPASPSIRRFARELGVDIHEVEASGPGGRITEADVKAHVKKGRRPDRGSRDGAGTLHPDGGHHR